MRLYMCQECCESPCYFVVPLTAGPKATDKKRCLFLASRGRAMFVFLGNVTWQSMSVIEEEVKHAKQS